MTTDATTDQTQARAALRALEARRQELEAQLATAMTRLNAPGGGGMKEPLVDREGYPRADLADLGQTRMDRNAVATLNTDLRDLMRRIETGLQHLHAASAPAGVRPCRV